MRKILAFILTVLSAIILFGCSSESQQYDLMSVKEKGSIVGTQSVQLLTESIDSMEILQQLSAGFEPESQTITLTIAGDCLLASDFGNVTKGSFAQKALEHDWTWFLSDAARYFETDDFTIVNLENVLTDDNSLKPRYKGEGKAYWYKAPTENTNILTEASVEVVDLANNHTRDYGDKGAKDTIAACENAGLLWGNNDHTVYLKKNDFTIALICHGLWSEGQANDIVRRIHDAEQESDFQIVYYHGGTERVHQPEAWRVRASRRLVDEGADLVIGNHPHVLQPRETYNGAEILYSMGNFCFGGDRRPENRTMLYRFTVYVDKNDKIATSSEIIPYYCYTGSTNNWRPEEIQNVEERQRVLDFVEGKLISPI